MKRVLCLSVICLALAGCSVLPSLSGEAADTSVASSSRADTTPRVARAALPPRSPAMAQCLTRLGSEGARFDVVPDAYTDAGCSTLGTVQLQALRSDRGQLGVSNIGPVTCPVGAAFAAWTRYGVDRAARQVFGSPLQSIETMGSYACRNVAGTTRRSAHASAEAIDIGGFMLANGRRISVQDGWNGSAQEREFLRLVQSSACRRFDTVLGPDYNSAHSDHLHLEGVIDGNSYCR
ncbi:extensin family protein [Aurantiacibacter aquimixticola]|uniref:Extensin n=1 Tax=Aurantiacibacter aquimixticola TaxID=1958945 RepID=A0A419RWE8_9SPHN|nr:extensin family protein [Aurantiacibacter aquimixticola]RJY10084.1 extensin [Aurantiacibacter aquimixticola]